MTLRSGTQPLAATSGSLLLQTGRAGLGAKVGHDLVIEVTRWRGSAVLDVDNPSASSVTLEAQVASLEVRRGDGGLKPLTDSDRGEIQQTIRTRILQSEKYPTITFTSTKVDGGPDGFCVVGDLTICGVTRAVMLDGAIGPDGKALGTTTITQSQFGIKPFSAMLGALKVADDIGVRFEVPLDRAP